MLYDAVEDLPPAPTKSDLKPVNLFPANEAVDQDQMANDNPAVGTNKAVNGRLPSVMYAKAGKVAKGVSKGIGKAAPPIAKGIGKATSPIRAMAAAPEGTKTNQYYTCSERFLPGNGLSLNQVHLIFIGGTCSAGVGWTKGTTKNKPGPFESIQIWKLDCFNSSDKVCCKLKIGHTCNMDKPGNSCGTTSFMRSKSSTSPVPTPGRMVLP